MTGLIRTHQEKKEGETVEILMGIIPQNASNKSELPSEYRGGVVFS